MKEEAKVSSRFPVESGLTQRMCLLFKRLLKDRGCLQINITNNSDKLKRVSSYQAVQNDVSDSSVQKAAVHSVFQPTDFGQALAHATTGLGIVTDYNHITSQSRSHVQTSSKSDNV